jgi:hypothetical protein
MPGAARTVAETGTGDQQHRVRDREAADDQLEFRAVRVQTSG